MEMTFEQAMRPGMLQAFANRRGSGYMMRSEKRGGGSYSGGPSRKPPRRKKAGFVYIFFTLLISLILWPVGMVMLWRRKVRLQAGTKLLISLLTLCLSVFLIVFALMVPVDNPEYTAFQDRANDWLDKAAVDVAAAGDAAYKKGGETWQIMSDFAKAGNEYALATAADAVDKGVELAGTAKNAIVNLFHKDSPEPTEAPDKPTEAPVEATEAPDDAKETEAPETTETSAPDEPAETEAAPDATGELDIHLPETTPDEADAQALSEGALQAGGSFVAGAEPTEEPAEQATEEPTEQPADAATEAPVEQTTEEPAEEPAVTDGAAASAFELYTPEPVEAEETAEPEADATVESETTETAEPEATETVEPEATEAPAIGAVKPAGQATVYYYVDGSKGFHRTANRHGMGGAPAHTLAEAFADGKTACNSCGMPDESILTEEHIAWVDESNRIHTTDECASFDGDWRLMPLAEAVEAEYAVCPDCGAMAYLESVYPAPTATPEPKLVTPTATLKPIDDITVYYYDVSVGYHVAADCVGMSGAPAGTLGEAVAAGKHACGNCNPPDAELIGLPVLWLDENKVCHTSDECAAFSGKYSLIARDDALAQALTGCPDCGATEYLVPGTALTGY